MSELKNAGPVGLGVERSWHTMFERQLPRQWILASVVILTLFAFAIRIRHLGLDSFWIDELNTIWVSSADINAILNVRDHPPLLYLVTKASLRIFGESEFGGRLPSLMASLPAIPLLIALGRAFKYPLAGIVAAFLLALSPFHLRHAQEARHYAMFMTVSLVTYLLLYWAIKRPTVLRWVAYGLATTLNLFTHYGALVVLAVQAILIAGWSMGLIWRRKYRQLLYPASAAVTVILLYAIRIPQLERTFGRTFSDSGGVRHNVQADLGNWLDNLYPALGTNNALLAVILLTLCVVGILILLVRREWLVLSFTAVSLIMPLTLILITGVDRTANPRYVIYLLPIYLLLASIAFTELIWWLRRQIGPVGGLATITVAGILVLMASFPLIKAEYAYTIHDWRNIAGVLEENAEEGDLVVVMTLSLPNGYNIAGDSLRYYLEKGQKHFYLLQAGELRQNEAEELVASVAADAKVWGVVMYWGSRFEPDTLPTVDMQFPGSTHLVQYPAHTDGAMEEVLRLYDQMLPLAHQPYPHCLLKQDMAIIQQHLGNVVDASVLMAEAFDECPEAPNEWLEARRPAIIDSLLEQLLAEFDQAKSSDQPEEIRELATALLIWQPSNGEAASYSRFADLLEMFELGLAQTESTAPEPISRASFGMPPNNYEGDALLLHAPGQVSYRLMLPEDPTVFRTRIAMVPDSWEWGGDGSTFVVLLETEDGRVKELLRQYISNERDDRHWHTVEIPLGDYAGQDVTLTLKTEPGPANNITGDWAIWDRPAVWWGVEGGLADALYK